MEDTFKFVKIINNMNCSYRIKLKISSHKKKKLVLLKKQLEQVKD